MYGFSGIILSRVNVRIFRHNFVGDKAKIRRRAVALQGFLTQSPAKFDEKTCMNPYVDRFLISNKSSYPDKCIVCRQYKQYAVKSVHKSTVTGHDLSVVLDTGLTLYHRC